MVLLILIAMGTLFITPFIYNFFIKKGDLFAPQTFFSLFQFGFHMPWLFSAYFENKYVEHSVLQTLQMSFDEAIPWYAFVHCVFFCMVYLGCMLGLPPIGKFFIPNNPRSYVSNLQSILFIGLVLVASLGASVYYVQSNGGLAAVFLNLGKRIDMLKGKSYITQSMKLAPIVLYAIVYQFRKIGKIPAYGYLILVLFFVIMAATLSPLGGRKDILFAIIFSVLFYHYGIARIRHINLKVAIPAFTGILLFIFFVGVFRSTDLKKGNVGDNLEDKSFFVKIVSEFCYSSQYMFITNFFTPSTAWYGASYGDILVAPIPRSIYGEDKPPLDDGVYISSSAKFGKHITPPTGFNHLFKTSWPPETLGIAYANFLLPGVIVFGFMLGIVHKIFYINMYYRKFSFLSILFYCFIIFNFHFSNLRMINNLVIYFYITVLYFIAFSATLILEAIFKRRRPQVLAST